MSRRLQPIQVAILIVCYNGRDYLSDCLAALLADSEPGIEAHIVVLDNASSDQSAGWVAEKFPTVHLIAAQVNLGFAGGNNAGWSYIHQTFPTLDYLALLNQDTEVGAGWLGELVAVLRAEPQAACAQAKLRLHPRTDRLNSAGNRSHFLGFGFTRGFGQLDRGQFDQAGRIDFASGAAQLLDAAVIRQVGLFDEAFFAYLEDAELSWRLRLGGWHICYAPRAVVYHKYEFQRNSGFYYHLERNRWLLLLGYYKIGTLLLLLPALGLMEIGQWLYALGSGVAGEKAAATAYFFKRDNVRRLARRRREIQSLRQLSDRAFLSRHAGRIDFPPVEHPLLRYLGNPLLDIYWRIARKIIFW